MRQSAGWQPAYLQGLPVATQVNERGFSIGIWPWIPTRRASSRYHLSRERSWRSRPGATSGLPTHFQINLSLTVSTLKLRSGRRVGWPAGCPKYRVSLPTVPPSVGTCDPLNLRCSRGTVLVHPLERYLKFRISGCRGGSSAFGNYGSPVTRQSRASFAGFDS